MILPVDRIGDALGFGLSQRGPFILFASFVCMARSRKKYS